jgi:serine/threonine protein kinase
VPVHSCKLFCDPAGVLIGAGSFAKVYRARWRHQPVAVKVLHLLGSKAAAKAMDEAAVMIRAHHPNVVAAHHVTMWQRARQRDDDFAECAGSCVTVSSCSEGSTSRSSCCLAAGLDASVNSSDSVAAGSGSGNLFITNTASTNGLNSSSGDNSTSIIEGGWGQDELCEQGQQDGEEDVETQAWIVLELCDGTLDTAARSGQLSCLVSMRA